MALAASSPHSIRTMAMANSMAVPGVCDSTMRCCSSLITLAVGIGISLILSTGLGLIARSQGLLLVEALPEEVTARLQPNILDLGIALTAGA